MRPIPVSTLLVATLLAAPLSAQIGGALRPAAAQRAGQVTVQAAHLQSLQGRLDGFAAQLPAEERALWDHLLLRAAHAASPGRGEVRVTPVLEIGPGGGCDDPAMEVANRVAIVVQGGRTAGASGIVVQGGRTPAGVPGADGPRPDPNATVAIGPKQDDPSRPGGTGAEAIGPKQDDPGAPRPGSTVSIGPKQDDPAPPPQSLGRRLTSFSQGLPTEERAALNWLLTRAATAPEGRPGTPGGRPGTPGGLATTPNPEGRQGRPGTVPAGAIPGGRIGTPGGLPPGMTSVSLRQALGIDPLAIGPKQDDPSPPPPSRQLWILRF